MGFLIGQFFVKKYYKNLGIFLVECKICQSTFILSDEYLFEDFEECDCFEREEVKTYGCHDGVMVYYPIFETVGAKQSNKKTGRRRK